MLRHVLIFCGLIIAAVSAVTLTGGEKSLLSQSATWLSTRRPNPEPVVANVEVSGTPTSQGGRKHSLRANKQGHFEGDFRINGRNVHAMIDTGATTVALNMSTARRLGISLSASDFRYEVRTANGPTRAAVVKLEAVEIGKVYVPNIDAVVLEDKSLDGMLIGMSFLNRLRKFKSQGDRLTLFQ